jgi:hypothetical protein
MFYKLLNNRFTQINPFNYIIELINNTNFSNNNDLKEFLLNYKWYDIEQYKKPYIKD